MQEPTLKSKERSSENWQNRFNGIVSPSLFQLHMYWLLTAIPAEAVDAAGAHPFESDLIRRGLYKLFDLPFTTTGKNRLADSRVQSRNPLKVILQYIGRCIRKRRLEAFIHGAIDIFARQVVAFAGGLILIVPVILMSFKVDLNNRLIIMSCFVAGFAVLIGIFTRATNQEVLAATAVYTAVLVLFVPDSPQLSL